MLLTTITSPSSVVALIALLTFIFIYDGFYCQISIPRLTGIFYCSSNQRKPAQPTVERGSTRFKFTTRKISGEKMVLFNDCDIQNFISSAVCFNDSVGGSLSSMIAVKRKTSSKGMLWPLVLFVLLATIEAADVKKLSENPGHTETKTVPHIVLKAGDSIESNSSIDFNIINGTEADIDEFPFYAMLTKREHMEETLSTGAPIKLVCGSSLVHPRFLITAWHCFKKDQDPKHAIAVFHVTNRCEPDVSNIAWHELRKIHFYPKSVTNKKIKRHDLVLLEMRDEVTDISPLLMPSQPPTLGAVGTIIGFGRTAWSKEKLDDQVPCTLRKTFETVEAWDKCRHPGEKVIGAFCGVATNTTACRGDSGGPWLIWNSGAYELQGIVSFGSVQCDARQANDHYTNVFAYKDWILTTIRSSLSTNNNAVKTSSAVLEARDLGRELGVDMLDLDVNTMDSDLNAEQPFIARDPVYPQYLYKPKNFPREKRWYDSQPVNGVRRRDDSLPFQPNVRPHPLPGNSMQLPQPIQKETQQWTLNKRKTELTPQWLQPQWLQPQQLQTPLSSQWLQQIQPQQLQTSWPQQQLAHLWQQPLQLQTPQQWSALFPQQQWNMQQLQRALMCYGQFNQPPFCFPQNYQQQPSSNQPLHKPQ